VSECEDGKDVEAGLAEWQRETKELLERQERGRIEEEEADLREWERQQREKEEVWHAKRKQLGRRRRVERENLKLKMAGKMEIDAEGKPGGRAGQRVLGNAELGCELRRQQREDAAPTPTREEEGGACKTCGGGHRYCVGTWYSGRKQLTRTGALRGVTPFQAVGCTGLLEGGLRASITLPVSSDGDGATSGCVAHASQGAADSFFDASWGRVGATYSHYWGGLIRGFVTFCNGFALQHFACLPPFAKAGPE